MSNSITGPIAPASHRHAWTLVSYLMGLLCLSTLLAFSIVGLTLLLIRIPQLEADARARVSQEARSAARSEDLLLQSIEERLEILAATLRAPRPEALADVLNQAVGDGSTFLSMALLSPEGRVQAVGAGTVWRWRQKELLGQDLSRSPLVERVRFQQRLLWDERHPSMMAGELVLALARPLADGRLLLAEVPTSFLFRSATEHQEPTRSSATSPISLWLLDASGRFMANSEQGVIASEPAYWRETALYQSLRQGLALPEQMELQGVTYHVAVAKSQYVDWYVAALTPQGLSNPRVKAWVTMVSVGFLGMLMIGVVLSPLWATGLKRALQRIVEQAKQVASGQVLSDWPKGPVLEFNRLSEHLESMSASLRERQQHFRAIFDVSPIALAVYDPESDLLIDLNEAACRQFGLVREAVLGQPARLLPIWPEREGRPQRDPRLAQGETVEARLRHVDGSELTCRISVRVLERSGQTWQVWALEDISEAQRHAQELRTLNEALEARVAQRTEALQRANDEASQAIDRLHETRDNLVRSEKMAALGGLVAGVAHELNTPLGNSLMAISTLRDETQQFKDAMAAGLRKSTLEAWIDCVDQATSISTRNLKRAADLVTSFKQVAVDQSSAHRRVFVLDELVNEILLTLKPSYSRLPITFEVQVAPGLKIDSYPGHLGQVLTNLITNAIVHGLDGLPRGTVRIDGAAVDADWVSLQVVDDGHGIAPDLIARVFDPFVTTRMGRGGTGLGLNISYNAATHVLGGRIEVHSELGQGACFSVVFPRLAPARAEVSRDDVQTWD